MHVRVGLIAANATELHRGGHRGIVLVAEVVAGELAEEVVEMMEERRTRYWGGDLSVWMMIMMVGLVWRLKVWPITLTVGSLATQLLCWNPRSRQLLLGTRQSSA